jgi:hypothetical protein
MGVTLAIIAGSIVLTAVIIVVVLRQVGVMGPRKKVLATGVGGRALIVGVAPTGTVINEINYVVKFQLRVEVPNRAPYDVETKETVPITSMGAIVPGTVVAVKVDPNDPTAVFIDWAQGIQPAAGAAAMPQPSVADVAAALHDPAAMSTVPKGSAAELLRTGQPAQGFLKSFSDTGQTPRTAGATTTAPQFMDDPLYVLTVELHFGAGMEPIEGTVIHRVPRALAPTLRIGMQLKCAVDPGNPTREFAIDWDALTATPAQPVASWNPNPTPPTGQYHP